MMSPYEAASYHSRSIQQIRPVYRLLATAVDSRDDQGVASSNNGHQVDLAYRRGLSQKISRPTTQTRTPPQQIVSLNYIRCSYIIKTA